MNKTLPLFLVLSAAQAISPGAQALAAGVARQAAPPDMEQQLLDQGAILLGSLRQAREEGLRRDPWGMVYSLQQARRVVYAMAAADRWIRLNRPPGARRARNPSVPPGLSVPLGQLMELDRPKSGGREQVVARFDGGAGSVPLKPVSEAIGSALAALRRDPPALGAALLATEAALRQVRWDKGLQPKGWPAARDEVVEAYALALDYHAEALSRLVGAQHALAALPGGEPYARRLAALQAAPALNLPALSRLVRDLDAKVQSLRASAELAH
jgi:hypothetical protein